MKKALMIIILITVAFSVVGYSQDIGLPDSLIIGTVAVPIGAPSVMVPVYAVTDDSVASLNLPLRWTSTDNKINPGGVYFFSPLLQWDEIAYTLDTTTHKVWIHGMHDTGGDENPVMNTGNHRQQVMLIRMVIHSGARDQFVSLTPYTDSVNGAPFFALQGGTSTFTPVLVAGGINYRTSGIDDPGSLPRGFSLNQNYPNPFNARTEIRFTLSSKSNVSLDIFDLLGRRVKTLVSGSYDAGIYSAIWDGTDNIGQQVSSGVYFYNLKANDQNQSHKMVLLK
jgi:hypothetical protein